MKYTLTLYNKKGKFYFFKYFENIQDKDEYKRRIKYVNDLILIEDSTDIEYTI